MNNKQITTVILVRHGESEGNVAAAIAHSKENQGKSVQSFLEEGLIREDLLNIPDNEWPLTEKGKQQAVKAGAWIARNFASVDIGITSEAIRAKETANFSTINPNDGVWVPSPSVNERSWGEDSTIHKILLNGNGGGFVGDSLSGRPDSVGSESLFEAQERWKEFISLLGHSAAGKTVMVATHGEYISMARAEIEGWSKQELEDRYNGSAKGRSFVSNGSVYSFQYSHDISAGSKYITYRYATPSGDSENIDRITDTGPISINNPNQPVE